MIAPAKRSVLLISGILLAHAAATVLDRSLLGVNALLTLTPMLAALYCFGRAQLKRTLLADKWRLFGLGLTVWAIGQGYYTYSVVWMHRHGDTAVPADFWFLAYGVFLLLSICIVSEGQDVTPLLLADGVQATIAIVLIYITLFMNGPTSQHALPNEQLSWMYFAENATLAGCASLRLLARPRGQERLFHQCLCVYAWLMLVICTVLIYINDFIAPTDGKWFEVFWLVPFFAAFPFVSTTEVAERSAAADADGPPWTTILIYNLNPMFFTTCVILLGAHLARQHPYAGGIAVFAALLIYTFRACILLTRLHQSQRRLRESQSSLRKLNDDLEEQNQTDALTGVANRRHFHHALQVEWNRSLRAAHPLSVIMIDLDHFKALNDRYGHTKGDQCIIAAASVLSRGLQRGGELLARYGGEEFVAVLPSVDAEQAMVRAEAMRNSIASLNIPHATGVHGLLTASVGVCSVLPGPRLTPEMLIEAADKALYQAKTEGRNRSALGSLEDQSTDAPPDTAAGDAPLLFGLSG